MWESVGVEVWELRETIEWGTLQTTTDLLWHVAHPWIVTPWKYHPHPPDRVLNWLCEVHLWSEHLAVMAGQPFCSSGMSQDLMSHLDLGTPPPPWRSPEATWAIHSIHIWEVGGLHTTVASALLLVLWFGRSKFPEISPIPSFPCFFFFCKKNPTFGEIWWLFNNKDQSRWQVKVGQVVK